MYFIVKVKFVEGNEKHPRHKIVQQLDTLEETLASLEDVATKYIIKKIKPTFTESEVEENNNVKIHCETKYTMNRNKCDNNIIEIHEKRVKTEKRPGTLYGKTEITTRLSQQIGYFYYMKYNNEIKQTCDNCLMVINRPVPKKVSQANTNPALLKEIESNAFFQTLRNNAENNRLDLANELSDDWVEEDRVEPPAPDSSLSY